MVVIRLARHGAKKRPFYHIVVADKRRARDGRYVEKLGYFNPIARGQEMPLMIEQERVDHWVSVGAQPSDRVQALIKQFAKQGAITAAELAAKQPPKPKKAKASASAQPQKEATAAVETPAEEVKAKAEKPAKAEEAKPEAKAEKPVKAQEAKPEAKAEKPAKAEEAKPEAKAEKPAKAEEAKPEAKADADDKA